MLKYSFEGGIVTRIIDHPYDSSRVFAYEVTFHLRHPRVVAVAAQKPPLHFHPYQEEYIEVLEGRLAVEVEGAEHVLSPRDGEFSLRPWCNHRLYSPVTDVEEGAKGYDDGWDGEKTVFLLSGQDTDEMFRLDTVFFENWYAYQDLIVVKGEKVDLVQVMSVSRLAALACARLATVTDFVSHRCLMLAAHTCHCQLGYRSVAQLRAVWVSSLGAGSAGYSAISPSLGSGRRTGTSHAKRWRGRYSTDGLPFESVLRIGRYYGMHLNPKARYSEETCNDIMKC